MSQRNRRVTQGLKDESRGGDKEEVGTERGKATRHQNNCQNNKEEGVHWKWNTWVSVSACGETTDREYAKEKMLIADKFL